MQHNKITKSFPAFIAKAEGEQGIVGAYTSIFGNVDYGWDVIVAGAFTNTIAQRAHKIRVLDNHNMWSAMDAVGKVLLIKEVTRFELPEEIQKEYPDATGGLYVEIQFMLDDELSAGIFRRIKQGVIDEYSIGFEILKQEIRNVPTSDGERPIRFIQEIKLYEVSPVIFAMNDATATASAKSKLNQGAEDKAEALEEKAEGEIYAATGSEMCANCKLYGKVTEDAGFCMAHKVAVANMMMCDAYESNQKRMVRDNLTEAFSQFMQGFCSQMLELGAWLDTDKERLDTMGEVLAAAFCDMLPKDMSEREIPVPASLTMPKKEDPQTEDKANKAESRHETDENALTLEAKAAALEALIRQRTNLYAEN